MGGVVKAVTSIVSKFIGWLIPIPEVPDFDTNAETEKGVLLNKSSNNAQIPIVYGRRQVGVTRVFLETSGSDNKYLYMACVLCEGEIEAIDEIYVDDKLVIFDGQITHGTIRNVSGGDAIFYKGGKSYIQAQAFFGLDNQIASSVLTSSTNWTANHTLKGVAYIAFRFEWNQDIFGQIPQVKVTLQGKKIYDPRDDTIKYSANSALVLLDYLRNTRYGKGLPDDAFESDFDSFKTSADDADTEIVPRTIVATPVAGLKRQDFNGYYSDNPRHFLDIFPTAESTVTSISGITTSPYTSDRYFGYINPTTTATHDFQTTSDDASHVYIGDAGQTVDSLFKEVEANRSVKLVVNNGGWHSTATQSGSKALTSGQRYPVIIYYGNAPSNTTMTFRWQVSGGSYSTDLSGIFTSTEEITDVVPAILKFETNAVLDTDQKVIESVKKLLNPMRGLFTYTNGIYKLKIEGTGTAVKTITKDNVIGGAKVLGERKNNKYNRILGTFVNPFKNWQEDTIVYPPIDETNLATADKHSTMLAEDNGTLLEGNFSFPSVTSQYNAEALCEVILRRSRNQLQIQLRLTSEFLDLSIGDIVGITYPSGGFDNKPFRVLGLSINEDLTVEVQLFEHQDAFYTFSDKNVIPIIADTILPNPNFVEAPAISVSDEVIELFDGSVVSKLVVKITNNDSFADEFEVEYKESSEPEYRLMRRGSNTIIEKYPVKEGAIYNIRARTINSLGVRSVFTSANHEVVTAFIPPEDVTNYSIDVVGDKLHHNWTAVSDLDLDYYEIRFTSDSTESFYQNTTILVPRIGRPATSVVTPFVGTGKYFIKAVDKFEVRSANADSVVIAEQVIDGVKPITTITEETAFTGIKTDCVVVDNALLLDTSDTFDDGVGDLDDAVGLFDGGNNSVISSGTYDFDGFDFGAKFKIKLLLNFLNVDHIDYVDNFDSQAGLFDSKEGLFDGADGQAVSTNVQLQIALSNDAVTYGAYQNFKAGDYVARAVKFRAVLTSTDTSATPKINNLSIKLLLPTVIQDGSNVTSGTDIAGKTVTFDNPYYQTPTLTIIAQNLNTGDYFVLNSKSSSNFNIEFFDSSANTVNRTFDYQAVGLGSQQ
jgi:hypothetical protein